VWKLIQVGIVAGFVYWNMLAGWTPNGYLPVLIGVMVAYVVSEIWFDLRLWWRRHRRS
jgi:hypothetical protein